VVLCRLRYRLEQLASSDGGPATLQADIHRADIPQAGTPQAPLPPP
jgi:hypothetical protein